MLLRIGQKLLTVHRRLFEGDEPRFFTGVIDAYEAGIVKMSGCSWVREPMGRGMVSKCDERTKIFSIGSGTLIIYLLPDWLDLSKLALTTDEDGRLMLTDSADFNMDMTEKYIARSSR